MDTWRIELPELGLVGETTASPASVRSLAPRVVRGDLEPPPEVHSQVILGGPDVARMLPRDDDDRDLAYRWADHDFWSVLMSLSIDPAEPETITSAWLRVDLAAADGGPPPIAFAMEPSLQDAAEEIQRNADAEATIKLLKIGGGEQRTYTARHDEVVALNRLRADPAWQLTPAPGRPLRPTDLALVVKASRGAAGGGTVSFGADIERRGFFRRVEVSWKGDPVKFSFE